MPRFGASQRRDAPSASSPTANDTDPNRPVLHRGKTETLGSTPAAKVPSKSAATTPVAKADRKASDDKAPDKKATQLIPAISDAGGPDPRPYAYDIKPDEDQKFRKKPERVTAAAPGGDSAARSAEAILRLAKAT